VIEQPASALARTDASRLPQRGLPTIKKAGAIPMIAVALVAGCTSAADHGPGSTSTPRPTVNAPAHPTTEPTNAARRPKPRHKPLRPYTGPVTKMPGISISYSGGPVQHHVRIHLIFWGGAWESSGADLIAAQDRLFASLDASAWTAILQQYRDHIGAAAQDVTLVGTWIDRAAPPSVLAGDLLGAEVIRAAAANRWSLGPDDQFILYPQANIDIDASMKGQCAYHQLGAQPSTRSVVLFAYAVVGCLGVPLGGLDPVGATSVLAAHESAEIMVDPTFESWGGSGDALESEVADLCQKLPAFRVQAGWLPLLFDRSSDTCRAGGGG
jgi:hypothetical protein